MLASNLVAIFSSGLIHCVCSLLHPQKYDFESMRAIEVLDAVETTEAQQEDESDEPEEHSLQEAKDWILKRGFGYGAVVCVIWPALRLAAGVFSKGFFSVWVFISLVWGFAAAAVIITLPIYESSDALMGVAMVLLGRAPPAKSIMAAGSSGTPMSPCCRVAARCSASSTSSATSGRPSVRTLWQSAIAARPTSAHKGYLGGPVTAPEALAPSHFL